MATLPRLDAAEVASPLTRRMAIVVGNNAGSGARPPLRYAERDAAKMARALREVGDVAPRDIILLEGRRASDLEAAVTSIRRSISDHKRTPGARVLLYFYFSGHGDGEALELGPDRVSFADLKALLAGTGADTRVAIIDACRSGAAILQKGGVPAAGFSIQLADQLGVTGDVFVTSTAANESALESSELRGSFFTHHFISGMRGAADASGDLRVTLAEVYRYAFERTVSTTAVTPAGTQHPSYKYELSGQGEIVLAALDRAPGTLEIPRDIDRVIITDPARQQVIAEVTSGAARAIALAPGRYQLRAVRGGRATQSWVTVPERGVASLEATPSTGALPGPAHAPTTADPAPSGLPPVPPRVSTAPSSASSRPIDEALRLCVLGFRNLTGSVDLDYLGVAFAEAITTDFGDHRGVRLIERGQIELTLDEMEFAAGKYVSPRTRAELGRIHGAEVVVLGSYQRAGRTLRVHARFVDVETGEVLVSLKVDRPEAKLLDLQDAVAAEVRRAVDPLRRRVRRR